MNSTFNPFVSVPQEQIQELMKPIMKSMQEDLETEKGFNNSFSKLTRKKKKILNNRVKRHYIGGYFMIGFGKFLKSKRTIKSKNIKSKKMIIINETLNSLIDKIGKEKTIKMLKKKILIPIYKNMRKNKR